MTTSTANPSRPMRIVHFLTAVRFEYGGPARATVDLCHALASRGHDVRLMTFDDHDIPGLRGPTPGKPRVIPLRPGQFLTLARDSRRPAIEALRDADALHLHGVWEPANLQLARIARRLGVPYFISARGMLDQWSMQQRPLKKKVYLAAVGNRWLRNAAAIHVTADAERGQAARRVDPRKLVTIPNLLNLAPFRDLPGPDIARARFRFDPGVPTILFLSRLHPGKHAEVVIQAAGLLRDRGIRTRVVIAGSGDAEHVSWLRSVAVDLGLADCVEFPGMVVDREKLSLYQAADVFALPTAQENFGFVLVESLACRLPVVTTKGAGIWPELERSGGAVITGFDAQAFAAAIQPLLADAPRRGAMGDAGRRWVLDFLDTGKVLDQFETMYRAGRSGGRG